jgi:SEC-C motif domain protein
MKNCPCGTDKPYEACCQEIINGNRPAETAEALMRSRYSAFEKAESGYIMETVHPDKRDQHDEKSILKWALDARWYGLEIIDTKAGGCDDSEGLVEFVAHYSENDTRKKHHELARFKKEDDKWYFYDGDAPQIEQVVHKSPKVGRNDPCPCKSGKKYKKCCGR